MPQQTYDWKRFWCPRAGTISLSDFGYPYDPDSKYGRQVNPDVVSFAEIASTPCLVLLGEAGMGKSTAVKEAYEEIKASGARCLWFRLGDYGSDTELCQAIFRNTILQDWLEGDEHLYLFLDSLDEGLLNINILTRILKRELGNLPCDRLSLRITCRTADWDSASSLEEKFKEKWTDHVGVYELVPLTRPNVIEAAQKNEIDPDSFIQTVFDRDAVPLAIKPTTLKFLINTYKQSQLLPLTQKELYLKGCEALCIETNQDRLESRNKGKLSEFQRMVVAARIATILIFANRSAIWTDKDLGDVPPLDITLAKMCTGSERIDDQDFQIIEDAIRETLSITSLFSSRGTNRMGFAHQTYAEFLAAWYVAEHHNLPLVQIMSLLTTPEDPEKRLVPQLHETAAWIAGMRVDVMEEITRTDPDVILRSDIPTDTNFKERFVENLLARDEMGLGVTFDERISNYRHLKKLKHPNLANQIQPYIQDCSRSLEARNLAIDIAEICEEKSLQDYLVEIALNPSENIYLRQNTAKALTFLGDSSVRLRLKLLATNEIPEDEDDSLKAYSLTAVWSEHLNAEELFQVLTHPKKANYYGSYSRFLESEIVKHLKPSDLTIALDWVIRQGKRHFQHPFGSVANAIIRFAWDYIEDPFVLELLAQIVLIQWKEYHGVVTEDDGKGFEELLLTSEYKRRLLMDAVVLIVAEEENPNSSFFLIEPI
jgi:predicted NACHT family NTPase